MYILHIILVYVKCNETVCSQIFRIRIEINYKISAKSIVQNDTINWGQRMT